MRVKLKNLARLGNYSGSIRPHASQETIEDRMSFDEGYLTFSSFNPVVYSV